jgi:hypothetical protein
MVVVCTDASPLDVAAELAAPPVETATDTASPVRSKDSLLAGEIFLALCMHVGLLPCSTAVVNYWCWLGLLHAVVVCMPAASTAPTT